MYSVLIVSFLAVLVLALWLRQDAPKIFVTWVSGVAIFSILSFMQYGLKADRGDAGYAVGRAYLARGKAMAEIDAVGRQAPTRKSISVSPEILASADAESVSTALTEAYAQSPVDTDEDHKAEIHQLVQAAADTEAYWKQKYADAQASYVSFIQREFLLRLMVSTQLLAPTIPDWVAPTFVCDDKKWDCTNLRIRSGARVSPKS